jgi:hypothetical protein
MDGGGTTDREEIKRGKLPAATFPTVAAKRPKTDGLTN